MSGNAAPNILLIISDQQRTDTLGFLGRTPCRTANLDRLAAGGVCFERAMTPCPLCGPARTSMFTGLYAHEARGTLDMKPVGLLDPGKRGPTAGDMLLNDYVCREEPLLTNLLKGRGYHTAYAGKWHVGNEVLGDWFERYWGHENGQYVDWCKREGLPDGWPLNDMRTRSHREPRMSIPAALVNEIDPAHSNDAWIADIAIRFIRERPKDRPFFVTCGFNGPHPPFKIPEPYFSMYDPASIPEPPNFGPTELEPQANRDSFYRKLWADQGTDWRNWQRSVAVYWGFVTLIDDQVGRLIECLEQEGVADETLIVFCSDHGEMLGQHGLWHKMHAYEEAIRTPLVFSAPWIHGGRRSQAAVSLLDIPSTLLAAVGIAPPAEYRGIDLSPAFSADESLPERMLFAEHKPQGSWNGATDWRMATDNRHKYTWNRGDLDEFYDLSADPYETDNRIFDPASAAEAARLRSELRDWMVRTADPLLGDYDVDITNGRQ